MSTAISESGSENRKRGRPAMQLAYLRELFPDVKTRRGMQNVHYRVRAMGVLRKHPRSVEFKWVCDYEACKRGEDKWKPSILAELGRIEDEDVLVDVAAQLCAMDPKPSTRYAVALIRRYRLNKPDDPHLMAVVTALEAAANNYLATHPSTTMDLIVRSLRDYADLIENSKDQAQ